MDWTENVQDGKQKSSSTLWKSLKGPNKLREEIADPSVENLIVQFVESANRSALHGVLAFYLISGIAYNFYEAQSCFTNAVWS